MKRYFLLFVFSNSSTRISYPIICHSMWLKMCFAVGNFFYVNRHESNLFAILCYLFFCSSVLLCSGVRKVLPEVLFAGRLQIAILSSSRKMNTVFFDSSCFCFFFYWKFLDFSLYSCLAKWCCRTFFAFGFSIWNAHNCAEFNESLVKISCAIFLE